MLKSKIPKEGLNQWSHSVVMFLNHNNDQNDKIMLKVECGMHTMVVTNSSLIGLKTCSTEGNHD